jgi:hypothetical protein
MKLIKNNEIKERSEISLNINGVVVEKPTLRQLFNAGWKMYIESYYTNTPEKQLNDTKKLVLLKLNQYDKSKEVNSFFVGDIQAWIDRDTRVSLMNSTQILKNVGQENTTLWLNGKVFTVPCDSLIQMLGALEIYALQCYNVTEQHKANINALESIEEIKNYDFKKGYPEKLVFNV